MIIIRNVTVFESWPRGKHFNLIQYEHSGCQCNHHATRCYLPSPHRRNLLFLANYYKLKNISQRIDLNHIWYHASSYWFNHASSSTFSFSRDSANAACCRSQHWHAHAMTSRREMQNAFRQQPSERMQRATERKQRVAERTQNAVRAGREEDSCTAPKVEILSMIFLSQWLPLMKYYMIF